MAVRGFHRFAVADGLAADDPASGVKPPTPGQAAAQGAAARPTSRRSSRRPARRAPRWRCATGRCSRCSTAPGPGSPRRSDSTSTTSTGPRTTAARCCCAARAARSGSCRSAPTPRAAVDAYLVRGRPELVAATGQGHAGAVPQRPRRPALPPVAPGRCCVQGRRAGRRHPGRLAAHAAPLLRHPPARRRRRRTRRAGAARPRLGDHDAGLHAGHRRQPARGVRRRAPARARLMTRDSRLKRPDGRQSRRRVRRGRRLGHQRRGWSSTRTRTRR